LPIDKNINYYDTILQLIRENLSNYEIITAIEKIRILELEPASINNMLTTLSFNGYKNLFGISKNKGVYDYPLYYKIKYTFGDPKNTHFPNNFFDMIFSFNLHSEFNNLQFWVEMERLISDSGILIIKTHKIDNVREFISTHRNNFDIITSIQDSEFCIIYILRCIKKTKKNHINDITIIHPHIGMNDSHYYIHIMHKFLNDGINCHLVKSEDDIKDDTIKIFELEAGQYFELPKDNNSIIEVHSILYSVKDHKTKIKLLILNILSLFLNKFRKIKNERIKRLSYESYYSNNLKKYPNLLFRVNEFGDYININNYTLMPHISYDIPSPNKFSDDHNIKICSFGVAKKYKHFEEICKLGIKLKIPVIIIATIVNEPLAKSESEQTAQRLIKRFERFKRYKNIKIITGYFTEEEIANELCDCTHIIFAQNEGRFWTSGSMRFAAALKKPVIAKDSWQAKEAQAIRFKRIKDITIDFLRSHNEAPVIPDGYEYLKNFLLYQYKK